MRAVGKGAHQLFAGEAGGHRWQRIPPSEKRGRVHSSTITVAVLDEPSEAELQIAERDLTWSTCRASGSGGQHLQKTDSAVLLTHVPTGMQVRSEAERSQHQNRAVALATLRARLAALQREQAHAVRAHERRTQIGSGMRGDKRRTVRVQDGSVVDHETGRSWRLRDYVRGEW
ncbi:MAG: peptide chain release factor-like protein [Kofleriaceae bacterium]